MLARDDHSCKFCANYDMIKSVHKSIRKKCKDEDLGDYRQEITVAFVIRTWYANRGKRNAGRSTLYRNNGIGYKLKYCPECGRKL